jgi:8-oxo-dGTP diphosphatase
MKLIAEIQEQNINPKAPILDESEFRIREAARAIVLDNEGRVALLHVGRHNFHKLPGGGIDEGENIEQALERELMEEIGCKAKVTAEIGAVTEHRNQFKMIQTSYCFLAQLSGEKGDPDFTEEEIADEFSIVWADNIQAAIELLEADQPDDYEGKFIKVRDLALLNAASI